MGDNGTVYARKGEWITCENGHEIMRLARTVHVGEIQDVKRDFTDWQQEEPALETRASKCVCKKCGARWMAEWPSGVFHFADGWRTPWTQYD